MQYPLRVVFNEIKENEMKRWHNALFLMYTEVKQLSQYEIFLILFFVKMPPWIPYSGTFYLFKVNKPHE